MREDEPAQDMALGVQQQPVRGQGLDVHVRRAREQGLNLVLAQNGGVLPCAFRASMYARACSKRMAARFEC